MHTVLTTNTSSNNGNNLTALFAKIELTWHGVSLILLYFTLSSVLSQTSKKSFPALSPVQMSNPVQPSPADLPSDPLLKPGAFIDANGQNHSSERAKPPNGSTFNGAQPETPAPGPDNSSSSADPKVKRRVVAGETWLPAGWSIEDRVRSSGATAGLVDKYYVDPSSGRKFRSKKEVLYFLETGSPPPKRKKGIETPGSDVVSSGISGGYKPKKSNRKLKRLNFDFVNVPEKVDWLLTDAPVDSWTPFLENDQVPESTKKDWAAAFTSLTASRSGQPMF